MKVLLRIRSDVKEFPGGDYIQLLKTKQALEQLGIECLISPGLDPIPDGVDVVHLFNTTRIHETYLQFKEAQHRGIPVVLTPIWHSMKEMRRFYAQLYRMPWFPIWKYQGAKELYYARRSRQPLLWSAALRYRQLQREVVSGANAVLPQSHAESDIMQQELEVTPRASFVIPPAFDKIHPVNGHTVERRDLLCVGRIEPRKNQLKIIHAFKSLGQNGHRLLLFGSMNDSHSDYVEKVKAELVPGWVEFRGQVSLPEVHAAYAKARAVVLASYFETVGFVAMEAMSCGAHAVVSDSPYTRDFYGDEAAYCDPFSSQSIRASIQTALAKPDADYRELLSGYSWDQAARLTQTVYQHVTS